MSTPAAQWTLTNADCIAAMRAMPDKAYDLAIVDPPYGIGVSSNMGRRKGDAPSEYKRADWDGTPPPAEYFNELRRVSRNQIIWGANHFIDRIGIASPCWIVWDKKFSEDVSFAQVELAWTSFCSTSKMLTLSSSQVLRFHPTQKPVALYKWLLKNYARAGDKILDTHGGSCSSVIAAIDMGFSIDAYELDPDYYAMALKRIQTHELQPRLIPTEQP